MKKKNIYIYISTYLSIYLSIYLSVYLSIESLYGLYSSRTGRYKPDFLAGNCQPCSSVERGPVCLAPPKLLRDWKFKKACTNFTRKNESDGMSDEHNPALSCFSSTAWSRANGNPRRMKHSGRCDFALLLLPRSSNRSLLKNAQLTKNKFLCWSVDKHFCSPSWLAAMRDPRNRGC